ncbi:MAG: vanadium-dependent haloperoxidase [Bryobacterales bacterium]|nr:vanadium-dependent haloperoxidase [Bryobacterales bacterium]
MKRVLIMILLVALKPSLTIASGEVVTRWVEHTLQTVRHRNVPTPEAGRIYAMVTVAIYDAVNGIQVARGGGRTHALVPSQGAPYNGQPEIAAAGAAHTVLSALVPELQDAHNAELAVQLATYRGRPAVVEAGRRWGEQVGRQVIAMREADGTQRALTMPARTEQGAHRASFDSRWRNMVPFGIASKEPYQPLPPPAWNSPAFTEALDEVSVLGRQDCDPERNIIAQFWLAEAGTVRETGIWLQAALAIARQYNTVRSLPEMARLFALTGMAIADAVLVSWEAKAAHFTWRPMVAVREVDTEWTSRIGSAGASPEYVSGTSTFGGAVSAVLEQFFRRSSLGFCFETDGAIAGPRCFGGPLEAATEAGRSRIYQGIHFRFSDEAGRRAGRALGEAIATTRLQLLQ